MGLIPESKWNVMLGLSDYSSVEEVPSNIFMLHLAEIGLTRSTSVSLKTDLIKGELNTRFLKEPEHWGDVRFSFARDDGSWEGHVVDLVIPDAEDSVLTYIRKGGSYLTFCLASNSNADLNLAVKWIRERFPPPCIKREVTSIPINFWSLSSKGPVRREQKIKPLQWDEIHVNYPIETRAKVDHLSNLHPPIDGGRLLLWHGPPGTGKTSAIRSLLYSILPWCDSSYIVDPEAFFGNADYMLQVLLDQGDDISYFDDDEDEEGEEDDFFILQGKDRWRLLIVEDADEFLKSEAKEKVGQALSRLLNLADGIIGQGLNFLILITTNEHLENIHKAVAREGRCLANIHFPAFSRTEAQYWLGAENEGALPPAGDEFSLAQLYDLHHTIKQIKNEKQEKHVGVYL